jgi:hypothetical protein
MPRDKDRKRIIRARMKKTGESYTAARAQIIAKAQPKPAPSRAVDYAALAGMSDAAIAAKTGHTWREWERILDTDNAAAMTHGEIARLVHDKHGIGDWWSQMLTVGYERIKGLRAMGQRRGGDYEAGKSKTLAAPTARVYRAFRDTRTRRRWLGDVSLTIRTAIPNKSMRITWGDGTNVEWYFLPKGDAKCQVAVQHGKLPDREAVDRMKTWWGERLGELDRLLTQPSGR